MSFEDKQHVCSDCWVTARDAERERIIKLLEKLDDEEWMGINQNFIALIKGENK